MSSVVLREHLLLVKCNSNERAPYFFSKISTYIYESYRKTLISLKLSCTSSFIPCPTRCFRHSTTTKNELKTKKSVLLRRAEKKKKYWQPVISFLTVAFILFFYFFKSFRQNLKFESSKHANGHDAKVLSLECVA